MTPEEKYRILLSTYPKGVYSIDTIEIRHPLFPETIYWTREPMGLTATDEDGNILEFNGVNFDISLNDTKNDLDENFLIILQDLDNAADGLLELIPLDNTNPIEVIYRAYNSDDLTAPGYGPVKLTALEVTQQKGQLSAVVGATQLNWAQTGIAYDYDIFPMLRALQ